MVQELTGIHVSSTPPVLVSFCTTCMGRLHHLSQTLPRNIRWNCDFCGVEFVLLDYSSPDGLAQWVRTECTQWLESGILVYYQAHGFSTFHMTHAKNIAHRMASGEIVCNLDADNYTGPDLAALLFKGFETEERIYFRSPSRKSANGRIAFRKVDFEALGGYDEHFVFGWGHDDKDIMMRARAIGLKERFIPELGKYPRFIHHGDEDSVKFNIERDKRKSRILHRNISYENARLGQFIANVGVKWGRAQVVRNFNNIIEV